MAVLFDTTTKFDSSGNSLSFSHTISTAGNPGLLVFVGTGKGNTLTVTGITYNTVAMTFVAAAVNGTAATVECWKLAAPATGANTVVVTMTGNPDPVMAVAMSATAVDQADAVSNFNSATGDTDPATVDVTSAVGELVGDMYAEIEGPDANVGAGQTERQRNDASGPEPQMVSSTEPGAATVTMSWGIDTDWAIVAASFKEVSAGTEVALTGVNSTGSVGSVGILASLALIGVLATAAIGTLSPTNTQDITGIEATSAVGTVIAEIPASAELTGVSATAAVGTVDKTNTQNITGEEATSAVDTVDKTNIQDITGEEAISAVDTIIPDNTQDITGVETTSAVGTVIAVLEAPPFPYHVFKENRRDMRGLLNL